MFEPDWTQDERQLAGDLVTEVHRFIGAGLTSGNFDSWAWQQLQRRFAEAPGHVRDQVLRWLVGNDLRQLLRFAVDLDAS
jgi:hypothetical protein